MSNDNLHQEQNDLIDEYPEINITKELDDNDRMNDRFNSVIRLNKDDINNSITLKDKYEIDNKINHIKNKNNDDLEF